MAQHDRDIVCLFKLVTKLAGHHIVDVLVIFEFSIEAHVEPIDLNQPFAQLLAVQPIGAPLDDLKVGYFATAFEYDLSSLGLDFLIVDRPGDELRLLGRPGGEGRGIRSEEHTSELQSLMRISYAVFCLK